MILATMIAAGLSACGGDGAAAPAALNAPALAFVAPQNTYDLSNYTLMGRYSLPVGAGANLLAQEASAITYNKDTGTLFVAGDGSTSIVQITKQGVLVDSMMLAADESKPQGTYFYDIEGLTYLGAGKFAMVEERYRQVNEFTYVHGTILDGSGARTAKLGTTIGNIGIEGITWDPLTGGFIAVKESGPSGIFQTTIDFAAGTASNGSPVTDNPVNLFAPEKTGLSALNDVFALSNVLAGTAPDYGAILVLSAADGKVVKMDRAGNIMGTLVVGSSAQNEGMTMDTEGNIYLVNEIGGGAGYPEMLVYSPAASASAVGVGSNLYLSFSQAVVAGSGSISLSNGAGDERTIAIGDATQVSISGTTVTINPSADLIAGTTYTLTYPAGLLRTAQGAASPASPAGSPFSFTAAGVADTAPPLLSSSLPADNATEVAGSSIVLNFNEQVLAGAGDIVISNGAGDTRTISVGDATQVTVSGNSVTITPSANLLQGASYNVQFASGVIKDLAGNAFAGLTSATDLSFDMAASPPVAPSLLITEVNSNAAGGDFFELYNYGATDIDLSGWKWDDDSASFSLAAAFPNDITIAAGARLVVLTESLDANAFRTAWGLDGSVQVVTSPVAVSGLGLGGSGDAVVLFNPSAEAVAWFNYKGDNVTATDGTVIAPAVAASGITRTVAHAGSSFGGTAVTSAVWDGVSTSAPAYKAAVVGVLGGFAQTAVATAIGSPGQ